MPFPQTLTGERGAIHNTRPWRWALLHPPHRLCVAVAMATRVFLLRVALMHPLANGWGGLWFGPSPLGDTLHSFRMLVMRHIGFNDSVLYPLKWHVTPRLDGQPG